MCHKKFPIRADNTEQWSTKDERLGARALPPVNAFLYCLAIPRAHRDRIGNGHSILIVCWVLAPFCGMIYYKAIPPLFSVAYLFLLPPLPHLFHLPDRYILNPQLGIQHPTPQHYSPTPRPRDLDIAGNYNL